MSKKKYTIRRDAGEHLTQQMRETLGTARNQYVNRLAPISLRQFARLHNVPYETWRREFRRGAVSTIIRHGNRWTYPEYDLGKATASVNEGKSNMGAKMKLTMPMATLFRHAVLHLKRALPVVLSVTTDNGCEFLDQKRLDRLFRSEAYYTRAYASYEKGAVENCNRIVRRWHPRGTDFNNLTRKQIQQLEDTINSIHRESLNGETAYAYDSRLAKAA